MRRIAAIAGFLAMIVYAATATGAPGGGRATTQPGEQGRPALANVGPQRQTQLKTLSVQLFSGDFERWTQEATIETPETLTFHWLNIAQDVTRAQWQVVNDPDQSLYFIHDVKRAAPQRGDMRAGGENAPAPRRAPTRSPSIAPHPIPQPLHPLPAAAKTILPTPAAGAYAQFQIDFSKILPPSPGKPGLSCLETVRYVRVVVENKEGALRAPSAPVKIIYAKNCAPAPSFDEINPVEDKTYYRDDMRIGGRDIDWCRTHGKDCGKPAADNFCRTHGYRRARAGPYHSYNPTQPSVTSNGVRETITIASQEICVGDACKALGPVTCTQTDYDQYCYVAKSSWLETTTDDCSAFMLIINTKDGPVEFPWFGVNYNKQIRDLKVTPRFSWTCGGVTEHTTCPKGTGAVNIHARPRPTTQSGGTVSNARSSAKPRNNEAGLTDASRLTM